MMTLKDKIDLWLKGIGLVLAAVGFAWGLVQFADVLHQRRVTQTLNYVERYGKDGLLGARIDLGKAWLTARAQLEQLRAASVDPARFERRHRQLVFSVLNSLPGGNRADLEQDVSLLISFFDELAICVRSKLCDKKSAQDFFQPEARSFYCLYKPYADFMANSYAETYGVGVKELAGTGSDNCYK
ncbi:hypothetical protein WNZ14_19165 [Hoeflea sp. AS60]|uniref:hypothetical protein n=1 Tax=Hoeflea sp. AS60 TaxID=3135780 RepID=UPI003174032D